MMCMYVYVCIVYATHAVRNFILALSFDVKVLRLICNFTMSVTSNYAYSYRHARMHINFAFFNERMLYCFAWYSQLLWNITYSHRYASSNLKKKNDTMDCSFLNDFPELNDAIELRLSALYFQVFTMNRKFRFIVVFFITYSIKHYCLMEFSRNYVIDCSKETLAGLQREFLSKFAQNFIPTL